MKVNLPFTSAWVSPSGLQEGLVRLGLASPYQDQPSRCPPKWVMNANPQAKAPMYNH